MILELMPWNMDSERIADEEIFLEDYCNHSNAVYVANNTERKALISYKADTINRDRHGVKERRCDYILASVCDNTARFIELKCSDIRRPGESESTWYIAFEQLILTYQAYEGIFSDARKFFILSTDINRIPNAKYTQYRSYRYLREEIGHKPIILLRDEVDTI